MDSFRTKADSLPMPVTRIEPWDPVTGPAAELTLWLDGSLGPEPRVSCFLAGQRLEPQWNPSRQSLYIASPKPLSKGRQRVNCTAPGPDGRYHWFSHQWLVR
jgi:hypothetical protein